MHSFLLPREFFWGTASFANMRRQAREMGIGDTTFYDNPRKVRAQGLGAVGRNLCGQGNWVERVILVVERVIPVAESEERGGASSEDRGVL